MLTSPFDLQSSLVLFPQQFCSILSSARFISLTFSLTILLNQSTFRTPLVVLHSFLVSVNHAQLLLHHSFAFILYFMLSYNHYQQPSIWNKMNPFKFFGPPKRGWRDRYNRWWGNRRLRRLQRKDVEDICFGPKIS